MDKPLTRKQLELLLLLYKFRALTVELITQISDAKSPNRIRERLGRLVDQGYVGRRYDAQYRLASRHAEYFLLGKGIAELRKHPNSDEKALHKMYRDNTASANTVIHRLAVTQTYALFKQDNVRFITQSQLGTIKGLPKPLPDALMALKTGEGSHYFLVEVLHESDPYFVSLHRRLKRYIEYSESGDWEIEHRDAPLPAVLIICDTQSLLKRLTKRMANLIESSWNDELNLYASTLDSIKKQGQTGKIWQTVDDEKQLVSFSDLLLL